MSYGELFNEVQAAASSLREFGIERGRVVGLALPSGPEMGTAFLAALSTGIALPINPNAPAPETLRFLRDAHASAVILPAGTDTPARQASAQLELPLVEVSSSQDEPAGTVHLDCRGALPDDPQYHLNADLAMLMFTGGTTGRSKIVQLTTANLQASTGYFLKFARLSPEDRELNIMPMFHVQGLLAAFLSTILSGGSIVCTPGFDPAAFFDWFAEYRPSWFSASPTILQAIANRASAHSGQISNSRLRFIRCSAAPLPQNVVDRLQRSFKAPVSEALGMTEAGGSITQNPLPPGARKDGTLGPSVGPELAIMAEGGSEILPRRVVGEVVVRGPCVTPGYLEAPEDNARLFTDGWLRSGDQGFLDSDGYLTITGRLKDMYICGGFNCYPAEIEKLLCGHPQIHAAAVVGVPDERLGEIGKAYVVLRPGQAAAADDIIAWARAHMANYKVPRAIVFVRELPTTASGKVLRMALRQREESDGKAA